MCSEPCDAINPDRNDDVKRLSDEVVHLHRALESRTIIGEALGVLMERFTLDENEAFEALRRASQASNTKISELAAKLVATGQLRELN